MVQHGGDFWKRHLMFRDYLRSHPDVAQQYCELKRKLAEKHGRDREAYTDAKTSLVESVLAEAGASPRHHVRFIRLPTRVLEKYDDLIYQSRKVIVGRSQAISMHSIEFDGKVVSQAGFPITYFELMGRWFNVVKVRNLRGEHTGYYCDITTPPKLLKDGSVEITDLFLDLWVSPDLRYMVLDQDELEEALKKGWVSEQLYVRANRELKKLVALVEMKDFPPRSVRQLEKRLKL
jgi:predicted RNA-binding protein associated with RNAse of E/G family